MTVANFGPGDKAKIQALINGGVDTMREIATLRESLKDTIEAVAEELDIEKKYLASAVRISYKQSVKNQDTIGDMQTALDQVEELLKAAGV
jgi:hypothetical protein